MAKPKPAPMNFSLTITGALNGVPLHTTEVGPLTLEQFKMTCEELAKALDRARGNVEAGEATEVPKPKWLRRNRDKGGN